MTHYDVVIVGSGLAGSILARLLRRRGQEVLLLEKDRHPRFALGESTTPLANLALERLAARYDLPDLHHLSTHGRWLTHLPQLRRGRKRGFTFFHHQRGEPYHNTARNEARLLVAASLEDRHADTHWLRQDVDHHLVQRALAEGVSYRDRAAIHGLEVHEDGFALTGTSDGEPFAAEAGAIVDGSGRDGFLARALPIASETAGLEIRSDLLYAHVEGLRPFAEVAGQAGATLTPGPYPDERAAVHHLLDIGWLYVLPFDHGVTSVGLILHHDAERPDAAELDRDPEAAFRGLIGRYPTLAAQFADARPVVPWRSLGRMQYRLASPAGRRWFLLPHTYGFLDPLFSTGIAWSLTAVERLADLLTGERDDHRRHATLMRREAAQIERLVEGAYLAMRDFELFTPLALLYFAAVSFTEARQRLVEPGTASHAWEGFLGAGEARLCMLFDQARQHLRDMMAEGVPIGEASRTDFRRWLLQRIAPYDIAGLADETRSNLFPVDLEVLVERAHLLGLSRGEARAALPRLRGEEA